MAHNERVLLDGVRLTVIKFSVESESIPGYRFTGPGMPHSSARSRFNDPPAGIRAAEHYREIHIINGNSTGNLLSLSLSSFAAG